jgi:hypothetical protein
LRRPSERLSAGAWAQAPRKRLESTDVRTASAAGRKERTSSRTPGLVVGIGDWEERWGRADEEAVWAALARMFGGHLYSPRAQRPTSAHQRIHYNWIPGPTFSPWSCSCVGLLQRWSRARRRRMTCPWLHGAGGSRWPTDGRVFVCHATARTTPTCIASHACTGCCLARSR